MNEVFAKVIRGDMGECAEFNGYTEYFTCMLLMCDLCYFMDKVFDQRKLVHIFYTPEFTTDTHGVLLGDLLTGYSISVVNSYGYLVLHVSQLLVPTPQLPKIVIYPPQNIFLQYRKQ